MKSPPGLVHEGPPDDPATLLALLAHYDSVDPGAAASLRKRHGTTVLYAMEVKAVEPAWQGKVNGAIVEIGRYLQRYAPKGHQFGLQDRNGHRWGYWPRATDRLHAGLTQSRILEQVEPHVFRYRGRWIVLRPRKIGVVVQFVGRFGGQDRVVESFDTRSPVPLVMATAVLDRRAKESRAKTPDYLPQLGRQIKKGLSLGKMPPVMAVSARKGDGHQLSYRGAHLELWPLGGRIGGLAANHREPTVGFVFSAKGQSMGKPIVGKDAAEVMREGARLIDHHKAKAAPKTHKVRKTSLSRILR